VGWRGDRAGGRRVAGDLELAVTALAADAQDQREQDDQQDR
jgi:hypothetical protein